jgi:hypothetical protein
VYDLGLDTQSMLVLKHRNIRYRLFDYNKYPDYFQINVNAGEYAWKPIIIQKTMNEILETHTNSPKILLWCDAGDLMRDKSLQNLKSHILRNKIYSPDSEGCIPHYMHPKTLDWFSKQHAYPLLGLSNRNGAILGFYIDDPSVQEWIQKFYDCALEKECIAPEGSSRSNHRQDQSVFTILYHLFFLQNTSLRQENSCFGIDYHKDID